MLEQDVAGDSQTAGTFFAQRRISLSNFKRFQSPSSKHDEGQHFYERSTKSSRAFREQLVSEGKLSIEEDRELAALERSMEAVHPLVDGVIFLG